METKPEKLIKKHENLVHSEMRKVNSHVQRKNGDWIINTIMIEGCEVPFKYKRRKVYKNIKGQRVNITYYPDFEDVAGFQLDVMSIVRIRIA